jgi:hypothetical protein
MSALSGKLGLTLVLMAAPALALAQDAGHGESGGSGCGDVLGDLVEILRDEATGQPILEMRSVLAEQDQSVTAFCPIALDKDGNELPFLVDSCDPVGEVVAVDYFGRLSGGRTKERNSRMHFDEVISSIKDSGYVNRDETGRLLLGYDCETPGVFTTCTSSRIIDSPMENLALYARLMRYGHLQTNPLEEDISSHGDPALPTQYHPALTADDYAKFDIDVPDLLPGGKDGVTTRQYCQTMLATPENYPTECYMPESLSQNDLARAGKFLAGAADKSGKITVDLVQYMNRILKITQKTQISEPTKNTLTAKIRDCSTGTCVVRDPTESELLVVTEKFVNYSAMTNYNRTAWHNTSVAPLQLDPGSIDSWHVETGFNLKKRWLDELDGGKWLKSNVGGFVQSASDGLRAIEFVHNYAIPDDLWAIYQIEP